LLASLGLAASLTGTVKGPDGAAFKGAFVEAQNSSSRMTYNVLSHRDGKYRLENLPAGDYRISIRAIGYKAEPKTGVSLTADQKASADFALQKGMVRWTDLSIYQGTQLLPDEPGKPRLTTTCFACHGFQSRMASTIRDESGWRDRVNFMRTNFGYLLGNFNDKDEDDVVSYLTRNFGPDSDLAKSPADLPKYQEVKFPEFSDAAMRMEYVTYELPGANRFPGAAKPEPDGNVYLWTYNQHRFAKLDPKTAKVTEYSIPDIDQASNHSTVLAPDGSVWFTEQAENAIGKLDPATGKITKYHNNVKGNRHTMVITPNGMVYTTGNPLARFDPKTETWHNYEEVPTAYGLTVDKDENVWFSEMRKDGKIGRIDTKTDKITKYAPPSGSDAYPRRMHMDPNGLIWVNEYRAGKIASFDPKTEQWKEYALPGASPTPYALNIDKHNHIWYSSMDMDIIGELDPATSRVIEYPFVYAENGMRDFFPDPQGNMWWGSQPNNHVGYFFLAGPPVAAEKGAMANSEKSKTTVKKTEAPAPMQE